jgi:hypothetical protein
MGLRSKGTPEQAASFPKPLFLYQFIRAWNKDRNDPNFLEAQVAELERFGRPVEIAPPRAVPAPTPTLAAPAPPLPTPSAPPKRPAP